MRMIKRNKLIYGVGINDATYKVQPKVDGKVIKCPYYRKWTAMLERVYDPKALAKRPSYIGCSVVKEWHSFMNFRSWMIKQNWDGNQLDKDLLIVGNKIYSPDTCLFIPQHINTLFTNCEDIKDQLSRGVTYHAKTGKFRVVISDNNKRKSFGLFTKVKDAKKAYHKAKRDILLRLSVDMSLDKSIRKALKHRARFYCTVQDKCLDQPVDDASSSCNK